MSGSDSASRPRGSRADVETSTEIILIKNVSLLRATYQVRLLLYRAVREGKVLRVLMPPGSSVAEDLRGLIESAPDHIRIEWR